MTDFSSALYHLLGINLKARRESMGMKQSELSDLVAGLKRASISNIEKGRQKPPLHTIYSLCQALQVDVQFLLPTVSEVNELAEKRSYTNLEVENYINDLDLNEEIKTQIKSIIQKENETKL